MIKRKVYPMYHSHAIVLGIIMIFVLLLMSGCGTLHKTALKPGDTSLVLNYESIVLLSIKTQNKYKPGHAPEVYRITVTSDDADKTEYKTILVDTGVGSLIGKALKDMTKRNTGDSWEDLITLRLPPGSYRLTSIAGGTTSALSSGHFDFPFNILFSLGSQTIVYIGKIDMVNRKRESDDEVPSGSKFPLIDQAASGFGGGTFDVAIYDNFDQDQIKFSDKYPALSDQKIIKQILGPWEKPPMKNND